MKRLKKLFISEKAFSPVIAALILMLLAVASGVVVYAYVMGWLGRATAAPGGQVGELQFDSIYATASDDVIKIYVRNTGGKDLTLSDGVYVQGTKFTNKTSFSTTTLTVGSVKYLEVDTTGTIDLVKDYTYEVTIVCSDGTKVSQSVEAE